MGHIVLKSVDIVKFDEYVENYVHCKKVIHL